MCKVIDIKCVLTSSKVVTSGFADIKTFEDERMLGDCQKLREGQKLQEGQKLSRGQNAEAVRCEFFHLPIPMKCACSITYKHVLFWP